MACFLRVTASNASHVLAIVKVSLRSSVTPLSPMKMVQARIVKSSLLDAPRTLVYHDKISCPWVKGFPLNEGIIEG